MKWSSKKPSRQLKDILERKNEYSFGVKIHQKYPIPSRDMMIHLPENFPSSKSDLLTEANRIREERYGKKISASRNYFFPLVKYCRNSCLYCGFSRKSAERKRFSEMVMEPETVLTQLEIAKQANCREALFVLGDRPEQINKKVAKFFREHGFETSVDYVEWACRETLRKGLEPHVNLGVISYEEWEQLKPVIASAGLMLENISERLTEKGMAHHASPDKIPSVRIKCIEDALELKIPFTSGILIGIGETQAEREATIHELRRFSMEYETLQEIIVQPFHPLPNSPWRNKPQASANLLIETIAFSRVTLPPEINIQFPPNLTEFPIIEGIKAGANDLGGISPVTIDYVNYTSPWPKWDFLESYLGNNGFELTERGPVYSDWMKYSSIY
ncbi:MAG: 7,8-didemethyl-8-hydroxy-5-deazariboflavin synthase subunit CofG [Methanobacteriota archaeon]|nr:MAG: 7,8-didemethyl-8-hydroxy-5-deazariboflavin synthase subunit CofG [Euryarchaeota archaeon]